MASPGGLEPAKRRQMTLYSTPRIVVTSTPGNAYVEKCPRYVYMSTNSEMLIQIATTIASGVQSKRPQCLLRPLHKRTNTAGTVLGQPSPDSRRRSSTGRLERRVHYSPEGLLLGYNRVIMLFCFVVALKCIPVVTGVRATRLHLQRTNAHPTSQVAIAAGG